MFPPLVALPPTAPPSGSTFLGGSTTTVSGSSPGSGTVTTVSQNETVGSVPAFNPIPPQPAQLSINCQSILNAAGNFDAFRCNCESGFFWANNSCVRNCSASLVQFSNGTQSTISTCDCINGYFWNGVRCQPTLVVPVPPVVSPTVLALVDCSAVLNSAGPSQDLASCVCVSGYIWNGTACVVRVINPVNCSKVSNSAGVDPNNPSGCACDPGWRWDNGACVRNCSNVSNSSGSNADSSSCSCNTNFTWSNDSCAFNCSVLLNTNGSYNRTACNCVSGYYWNQTGCYYDCSKVANSTGFNTTTGQCNCKKQYTAANNTCTLSCSRVSYSKDG